MIGMTNHIVTTCRRNLVCWVLALATCILVAPSLYAQQASTLYSEGVIKNTGTLKIRGDAFMTQDSIGGVVRYERNHGVDTQLVAQLTYAYVHFEGASKKMILDPTEPLIADSLFLSTDTNVVFALDPSTYIQANRTVKHEGLINPGQRLGRFVLRGTEKQDVSGKGLIPILELDNMAGALVTSGGGLRVYERLDLQHGLMDNSASDNIQMMQGAWVWRDDSGSIADEPAWINRVHLRYYGDSAMVGGPEMVRNTSAIGHLINDDVAGLTLPHNITVNDSLVLRGHIHTEANDSTGKYALTYAATIDPRFDGVWPEVIGTMIRSTLIDGKTMVMNNYGTSIRFENAQDRGAVVQYSVRSMPKTTPLPLTDITYKVDRFLQLRALDFVGDTIPDSTYTLTFGYAWRNNAIAGMEPASVVETIPQLVGLEDQLVLMRYSGLSYNPYGFSKTPTTGMANPPEAWRYSTASLVRAGGDFAIGLSTGPIWVLNTRVFLEGPLRTYGENFTPEMSTDLAVRGLVPNVPPDIYPYSLDPDRLKDTASVIGDSIVDWVTVEFRKSATASGDPELIETLLLTKDGRMLDPQTMRPRIIEGIPAGFYNIAVRHRNHLAVITEDKVLVDRSNLGYVVDLTTGTGVFGGAAAQKLIGTANGRRWFGLVAGEVQAGDDISRTDYNLVWDARNLEGYLITDTDLNGIVTTRDINVSWNNRGRNSVAPR